jgi:hypothetical protein
VAAAARAENLARSKALTLPTTQPDPVPSPLVAHQTANLEVNPPLNSNINPPVGLDASPLDTPAFSPPVHLTLNPPAKPTFNPTVSINPAVTPVLAPPVKVGSAAPARKGRKAGGGVQGSKRGARGRARARSQPVHGYSAGYAPSLQMPGVLEPPLPVILQPPTSAIMHPSLPVAGHDGGHVSSAEHLAAELVQPSVEGHVSEVDSLEGGIRHVEDDVGHVAIGEGMTAETTEEHLADENLVYEGAIAEHFAPVLEPGHEHIEAAFVDDTPGDLHPGQELLGEEQSDPTGDFAAELVDLYPSEAEPYEEAQHAYTEEAYGQHEGYETGQLVTGDVYRQEGQAAYAQGHVVYEHHPGTYYAHDPYYGTYQVTAEGYQQGHVPYHPQYATPEYQHGYPAHPDPYGHLAPVMHPMGAYGIQVRWTAAFCT